MAVKSQMSPHYSIVDKASQLNNVGTQINILEMENRKFQLNFEEFS